LCLSGSKGLPMFLRRYERRSGGRRRTYWALVESVRTGRGSRQRDFGDVWMALGLWRLLGLDTLLEGLAAGGREEVPWPVVAAILVIARLCEPQSELHIESTWYRRTALEDLLGVPIEKVHTDRLYRGLDWLLPHKEAIEKHLKERLGSLFDYAYNGLGRLVQSTLHTSTAVTLDYHAEETPTDGKDYDGFDRFGRVKNQRWTDGTNDKDSYTYGHDYAGNRTWRDNHTATAVGFDQKFTYDGLHRLAGAERGKFTASPPTFDASNQNFTQDWSLDALGNWSEFKWDPDGAGTAESELTQTRRHNTVNEIEDTADPPVGSITGTGCDWIDPGNGPPGPISITAGIKNRRRTTENTKTTEKEFVLSGAFDEIRSRAFSFFSVVFVFSVVPRNLWLRPCRARSLCKPSVMFT